MASLFDEALEGANKSLQEQLELAKEQERVKQSQEIQRKKIQEKQIRALRNQYRPAGGFLNAGGRGVMLGETGGLPSKLGGL